MLLLAILQSVLKRLFLELLEYQPYISYVGRFLQENFYC